MSRWKTYNLFRKNPRVTRIKETVIIKINYIVSPSHTNTWLELKQAYVFQNKNVRMKPNIRIRRHDFKQAIMYYSILNS